jgi:hypothetical protein
MEFVPMPSIIVSVAVHCSQNIGDLEYQIDDGNKHVFDAVENSPGIWGVYERKTK